LPPKKADNEQHANAYRHASQAEELNSATILHEQNPV
jgi:hypothetical protein